MIIIITKIIMIIMMDDINEKMIDFQFFKKNIYSKKNNENIKFNNRKDAVNHIMSFVSEVYKINRNNLKLIDKITN